MSDRPEIKAPKFALFTKTHHHEPYPFISPTRPELSADGKNVVVTGGGTGIGKAIAVAFGQAGAKSVSIVGRRLDRLESAAAAIAAAGPSTRVICKTADLSQSATIESALKSITEETGKIDIFVSNAGMLPELGSLVGYDVRELARGLELNVVGAFNAVNAFVPLATPAAKLFNVSSFITHLPPMPEMFAYAATKAAIVKLFEYVAAEHPEFHVVQIHPGVVKTELNDHLPFNGQDERKFILYLFPFPPIRVSLVCDTSAN